ncbi:MAG: hypothetical protein JNJ57_14285 [Saprospiraceae bacterium]|nr:hypothetical protein [Saprospiraceae bacterium]
MENNRVELAYDTVEFADETRDAILTEPEKTAEETVDFYLTEPVVRKLGYIVTWSKVIIVCTFVFVLIELVIGYTAFVQTSNPAFDSSKNIVTIIRSLVVNVINVWLIVLGFRFIKHMSLALKYTNNEALDIAFKAQNQYFKWVFFSMLANVISMFLNGFV